jgi:hypothetical protein
VNGAEAKNRKATSKSTEGLAKQAAASALSVVKELEIASSSWSTKGMIMGIRATEGFAFRVAIKNTA